MFDINFYHILENKRLIIWDKKLGYVPILCNQHVDDRHM